MPTLKKRRTKYFKEGLSLGLPYFLAQKYVKVRMGELLGGEFIDFALKCGFDRVDEPSFQFEYDDERVYYTTYRSRKSEFVYESFFGGVFKFRRLDR